MILHTESSAPALLQLLERWEVSAALCGAVTIALLCAGYGIVEGALGAKQLRARALPLRASCGQGLRARAAFDAAVRAQSEERLRLQAVTDELTGRPNRAAFQRTCEERAWDETPVGVLLLDLDRFRMVNDTLGHSAGDALLVAAAARFAAVLGEDAELYRLAGDEFVVLHWGGDEASHEELSDRLLSSFEEPVQVAGEELYVSVSIGVSTGRGEELRELLGRADRAMNSARDAGRGRARVSVAEHSLPDTRLQLFNDLAGAIVRNEFELEFQPVVSLEDGSLRGAEALVRWEHPLRGRVQPGEFIPFAEETGQIVAIGEWVLRAACAEAAGWEVLPGQQQAPHVAVNLSAAEIERPGFLEFLAEVVAETGIEPARLWLEITERTASRDPQMMERRLFEIAARGVRISLDDFGTGWSSLSHLHKFPVEMVKVDRSFVIDEDSGGEMVVRSIVSLGHALGMCSTAEGIETLEQLERVRASGCDLGQGYLFSRPLQPAAFRERAWSFPAQRGPEAGRIPEHAQA